VGVPADHLRDETLQEVSHGELADLLGQTRVEDHLEEQIAELLLELPRVSGLDRLENLVCFLDQIGLQRGARLLTVPGAAGRPAQPCHDVEESFEENSGGLGHVRS
jgi:hypothetical protein